MLAPALAALMIDTVQLAPRTGVTVDRVESFGADVPTKARVQYSPKMIRDAAGRQTVASATIFLGATPVVNETDRVTLPNGKQPKILRVDRNSDQHGPHSQVIYV